MIIHPFVGAQLSNFRQAAPAQNQLRKDTPRPVANGLVIEAAQNWNRLQEARPPSGLGVRRHKCAENRPDQAKAFCRRTLLTRLGPLELALRSSRSRAETGPSFPD